MTSSLLNLENIEKVSGAFSYSGSSKARSWRSSRISEIGHDGISTRVGAAAGECQDSRPDPIFVTPSSLKNIIEADLVDCMVALPGL